MFESCLEKQNKIKAIFANCENEESKYEKIIELGKLLKPLDARYKDESHLVRGCQSLMYLRSFQEGSVVHFEADSDALVSRGLAYLLVAVYSGEAPEVILKCPPSYLEELNITASLTPNRANGLLSMHLKMKQEALRLLVEKAKKTL